MIEDLVANYLRVTSCLEIEKANSGHPGVCLGAAPIFEALYNKAFFCNESPDFISRDRIVFSAGHASALIYATLNLFGFKISTNDLKNFRKFGSITTGHPEVKIAPGIDASTGPLGQGIANAVGLAIAEEMLRNKFKKENLTPIDNYTYCFSGDGCLMEGVALEAISIAGNLGLNKLILLYDKNNITIEGNLDLSNRENVKEKFIACNWNVLEVKDGNKVKDIEKAIDKAKSSNKPTIIICNTHIGFGSEFEGSNKVHGKPLNKKQIEFLRQKLNYFVPDWEIPKEVSEHINKVLCNNENLKNKYFSTLKKYKEKYPKEFNEFLLLTRNFDYNFDKLVTYNNIEKFDGRAELHNILNEIGKKMPNLIGGCADVGPSTKVYFDNEGYFSKSNKVSRNIPFGIREHAMGAISNGISLYGPLRAFCSTFFTFENYMTPAIRMSALMKNPVLYLFTHDSITVGEDGPTHQPVEQIATLRCMPNIYVFRPAGRNELVASFKAFFKNNLPCAILISRQEFDAVKDDYAGALKGAYELISYENKNATIVATGSEVNLALKVSNNLKEKGIFLNVVSMPSVELFETQSKDYKNKIIDKSKLVFCIEASGDNVWYKFATGEETIFNVKSFGKSASGEEMLNYFGLNVENISKKVEKILQNN